MAVKHTIEGLEELGTPREGLRMVFRGCMPVEDGAFEGDYVEIELIIPPLNMANIKRLQEEEVARPAANLKPEGMLDYVATMTGRALRQNYRGVPAWLIEQSIDMENMVEISQKIAGIAGLITKKEMPAPPAKTPSPSTGTLSTAT